jgi:hypothetical protein
MSKTWATVVVEALWALGALKPKKWLKRPDMRVGVFGWEGGQAWHYRRKLSHNFPTSYSNTITSALLSSPRAPLTNNRIVLSAAGSPNCNGLSKRALLCPKQEEVQICIFSI